MTQIKRLAILTSGGDAPGMNAAIRAIVIAGHHYHIDIIGFYHGYNGLIDNESCILTLASINNIIGQGGTILKSARCPKFQSENGLHQAANTLIKAKIDALLVIGGDGSFRGLLALQAHWSGIMHGIPATIDNDLDGSDYTIGFSTAVNTCIEAIDKIRDTANAFDRIFIVELMGRRSGHITFNVGIACAAEQVLSFENFSQQDQAQKLSQLAQEITKTQQNRHASYIIVLAENLWPGGAVELARQLKQQANIDCTACILGHIQRGGSPTAKDRVLATKLGVAAVQAVIADKHNMMIGELNKSISYTSLDDAVKQQKQVSPQLIAAQQNILAINAQ
jgi:6-phosphofructokinase 1